MVVIVNPVFRLKRGLRSHGKASQQAVKIVQFPPPETLTVQRGSCEPQALSGCLVSLASVHLVVVLGLFTNEHLNI
jgi:hypothetical protein